MNPLLQQFLQESREALESIGNILLAMERNADDLASLDELFRLIHTLKGNSGLFDFPALTSLLHVAEDAMDKLRTGALAFNPAMADQLLDMVDYITLFLDEAERHEQPGEAFQTPPEGLIARLRAWLKVVPSTDGEAPVACSESAVNEQLPGLPDDIWRQLEAALREGQSACLVDYRPDNQCFFQGTDPLWLVSQLENVLWCRVTPRQPWPSLAELDAYDCQLRFELVTLNSEAQLRQHFRYVAEQITLQPITAVPLAAESARPQGDAAVTTMLSGIDTLALEIVRAQRAALVACQGQPWLSGQQAAIIRSLHSVLMRQTNPDVLSAFNSAAAQAHADACAGPLLSWLDSGLNALTQMDTVTQNETAPLSAQADGAAVPCDTLTTRSQSEASVGTKVLKIEQEKIDRLMNFIGEIVVAKNGLPYLAERAENHYAQRELAREIKAQYAVINRIAEDLQDAIMQVRMMPVSFVLQRFPRLVRDISRKLGKKVNLILEGEETEADKSVIEALADPLVHIIRNALDHGLESPEERVNVGKAEVGTLSIRASQNGDRVSISIADDGRGIDPQKIKAKVAGKGLIDSANLETMSDQELINLVFLPGFSTAEQVSELSGRGVGMDVVRSGVEKVGGQLRLLSQPGKGTELNLSLPLSMAVTQVMVIESAGQRFGIPMDQVMETVRFPRGAIHTVKQHPTAQLRGRTIPLKSLNQLLACDREQKMNDNDEYALIVLRSRGEMVGLLIDDFHGSNDIILKPMTGILSELSGYSGTAVMGDGSILMVLNPTELFE